MGDDYQIRKDIDRLLRFLDSLEYELTQKYNVSDLPTLLARFYDTSNTYSKEEIDELIAGGADLKNYVKKVDLIDKTRYDIDLNIQFGASGMDDIITIDMDIVDHIVNKTINIGG